MDWRKSLIALASALSLSFNAPVTWAQSSVDSRYCGSPGVVCVPIAGNVVFEAGATPPVEVGVRAYFESLEGLEQLDMRATAPEYRFEARIPRNLSPEFSLFGLAGPWLSDRAVVVSRVQTAQSITLRSEVGVAVTATFRYPQGTVAPPPFEASVRRSVGDRWFTPVQVANGQFTFFARRGSPYTISAAPIGFGQVRVEFPGQSSPHAVVVDVDRAPRTIAQSVVLVEGANGTALRNQRQIPLVLAEASPSGGGTLPYTLALSPGAGFTNEIILSPFDRVTAGRRQRIALFRTNLRDDAVRNGTRSAVLQFAPEQPGIPPAPDVNLTILDDEDDSLPPRLSVVGATDAPCCNGAAVAIRRPEGGPGEGWELTLELDKPAPQDGATVTVDTVAVLDALDPRYPAGVAVEGVGFVPVVERQVQFAPGSTTATVRIDGIGNDRIEPERYFFLAFTDPRGLVPRDPTVELRILNDDVDQSPAARPDLLPVAPLPRARFLDVLANDVLPAARFPSGALVITEQPRFGSAVVDGRGTASPIDDRIVYTVLPGQAGKTDRLRYRVCDALGETCVSARVDVPIRPVLDPASILRASSEGGFQDLALRGLPALADGRAELRARRLMRGESDNRTVDPVFDDRFGVRWNSNLVFGPVATDTPRTMLLHVAGPLGADIDLHVAFDANGDSVLSEDERLCSSASTGASETCLVRFVQRAGQSATMLVGVTNPGPVGVGYRFLWGAIDSLGAESGAAATMPTRLGEDESFPLRLSWRPVAGSNGFQSIVGLLNIRDGSGPSLGEVPVVIDLHRGPSDVDQAGLLAPLALMPGERSEVRVPPPGTARDRIFIDVPPGTSRLGLTVEPVPGATSGPVRVRLLRSPLPGAGANPVVDPAPTATGNPTTVTMAGSASEIVVGDPGPGRWYVVLDGEGFPYSGWNTVAVSANLGTTVPAPRIQPGGYFNASRSGHGLFVYPSDNVWAGLWYTYTQLGEPVWYYLQAAAPGADGIWTAPIFRSGWNGSRNHLTEVGRATITPTATDAFQFTYVLEGELGSEPFSSFGRGCPSIDGRVVDASGHWFDPARAGAGYSVQLLPNYEFYAVFAYSARGVPRFLIAERGGVGAASETLPLQQLRGFCPLCSRSADPQRSTVGVLRRDYVNGVLTRIDVDAAFTNGTPGTWIANDAVVPLGGLQGCAAD